MRLTLAPTKCTGRFSLQIVFYLPPEVLKWRVSSWLSPFSIPVDNYSSSIEQQTSLDRPELPGSMEQTNMARSQSAPMLDEDLGFPGHGINSQNQATINQKPSIPQKAYHFDHSYNPQVSRPLDVSPSEYAG